MARMFPERVLDAKTPGSERKVFDAFKELDDDWCVFHSVAWQGQRGRRQSDGEADFVLAHPKKGALVVEVKGGNIEMIDGQWTTTNRYGETFNINPFNQIRDSKHFLGEYLAEHISKVGKKVHMGHAVVFPDVEIAADLSAEGQREIILDRYDLKSVVSAIGRASSHWDDTTSFSDEQFSALRKALAPSRKIGRLLRHEVEDRVEELFDLTDQQLMVLGLLRRQRRALISGGAGTGKTVLAVERAKQLSEDGYEVLLLCFNAPLGDRLKQDIGDVAGLTVGSFHSVARSIVSDADLLPEGDWDSEFWSEKLPEALPDAASKLGRSFDAVIIDEGQDFQANWWTALELLLSDPDDGFMYVFADAHQDLYRSGWEAPFEGEPFELSVNCRNTLPIAERVNAVFEREEPSLGVGGPKPAFLEIASAAQAPKEAGQIVAKLVSAGDMNPEQVTVLSTDKKFVDGLRGQKIGEHKLVAPGKKGIAVETVHRFKGLENDAVVVVLPDVDSESDRSLAYVGMSRARVLLFVIGTSEAKAAINWG